MAFQELLRVRSVKHVEQNAFDGGVSHRGFPGCVDCPSARSGSGARSRGLPIQGFLDSSISHRRPQPLWCPIKDLLQFRHFGAAAFQPWISWIFEFPTAVHNFYGVLLRIYYNFVILEPRPSNLGFLGFLNFPPPSATSMVSY